MPLFDVYRTKGDPDDGQTVHIAQVDAPNDAAALAVAGRGIKLEHDEHLWVDGADERLPEPPMI